MTKRILTYVTVVLLAACAGTAATTTPNPELSPFVEESTVGPGESYSYTMFVTCGEAFQANGAWWVASEKFFEHPNYPTGWPVEVLNQSAADGPDASIESVLNVVDEGTVEFNLADGTPVAVFTPGDPAFCG